MPNANLKICLYGRPNVGKSSLFNRLIGKKKALVLDLPGVTRDVYRHALNLNGHQLELADLAGLEQAYSQQSSSLHLLKSLSAKAALDYLRSSDLVLFTVDARSPISDEDEYLARQLRSFGKKTLLVLTKSENHQVEDQAQIEYAKLGFGYGVATSAEHNLGIETLRETILENLALSQTNTVSTDEVVDQHALKGTTIHRPIQLGVYGRPNVGKSTLVNALLGEHRMITSAIAGTTVDAIDSDFKQGDQYFRILDTAGIRRKSKTEAGVEVLSVVQAIKSIEKVDIALFLIDGYEGVTDQDEKIAGEIIKSGKPIVLIVNKWDICKTKKEVYAEKIREALGFLDFAPVLFIAAEKNDGIDLLWSLINEILSQRHLVVNTSELNRFLEVLEGANNPLGARIYYASQTSKNPPTITILVNHPDKIHFAYERYLKNELKARYGWLASPLKLVFKARKRSASKKSLSRNH